MDAKKKYTIEFLYTDNNQLYQEDVELTDAEYKRVNAFLTKLERTGSIELTVEGGSVIYPYCEPDVHRLRGAQGELDGRHTTRLGKDRRISPVSPCAQEGVSPYAISEQRTWRSNCTTTDVSAKKAPAFSLSRRMVRWP